MSRFRSNEFFKQQRRTEKKVQAFGCVIFACWLVTTLLSLVLTCGLIAAVVAGAYYLCTGEFIFG